MAYACSSYLCPWPVRRRVIWFFRSRSTALLNPSTCCCPSRSLSLRQLLKSHLPPGDRDGLRQPCALRSVNACDGGPERKFQISACSKPIPDQVEESKSRR